MNEQYSWLSPTEQTVYEKVYRALLSLKERVSVSCLRGSEEFTRIITAVSWDHPEIFYVDFQNLNFLKCPTCIIFQIRYIGNKVYIHEQKRLMENRIQAVKSAISYRKKLLPTVICRRVHNYLIRHVQYNHEALQNPEAFPEAFSVQGVLDYQNAVCEGIAKAFKLICNHMGVDCVITGGIASEPGSQMQIPHAWNIVRINRNWFHVDVTWDLGMSAGSKSFRYDYYMIPDGWVTKDHDYRLGLECNKETESYFYQNHALIEGFGSLNEYIDRTIRMNNSCFYFKIMERNGLSTDFATKIQTLLSHRLVMAGRKVCVITAVHNEAQSIYFFKVR